MKNVFFFSSLFILLTSSLTDLANTKHTMETENNKIAKKRAEVVFGFCAFDRRLVAMVSHAWLKLQQVVSIGFSSGVEVHRSGPNPFSPPFPKVVPVACWHLWHNREPWPSRAFIIPSTSSNGGAELCVLPARAAARTSWDGQMVHR